MLYMIFCKNKKLPKPSKENGEENWILILEQRIFRVLDQKLEYDIQIWGYKKGTAY